MGGTALGRAVAAMAIIGLGCSPNSAGFGSGATKGQLDSGTPDGQTDTEMSEEGTDSPDSAGSGAATGTTGGDPPPTTSTTPPDDGTTSGTTGDPPPMGSSSDGPGPVQTVLERANFANCNQPVWCYSGTLDNPAGGPMWMQECFNVPLTPPFDLVEVEMVVRGLSGALGQVDVEVYGWGGTGPSALLGSRSFNGGMLSIGTNTIPLDPPITLNDPSICIGFAAPEPGLASALGISVDHNSLMFQRSYFRLGAGPGCNFPSWTDVVATIGDPGNWCIRATVEQ